MFACIYRERQLTAEPDFVSNVTSSTFETVPYTSAAESESSPPGF